MQNTGLLLLFFLTRYYINRKVVERKKKLQKCWVKLISNECKKQNNSNLHSTNDDELIQICNDYKLVSLKITKTIISPKNRRRRKK